eukprot:363122-Chlamydomonas_euryale.AAC.3
MKGHARASAAAAPTPPCGPRQDQTPAARALPQSACPPRQTRPWSHSRWTLRRLHRGGGPRRRWRWSPAAARPRDRGSIVTQETASSSVRATRAGTTKTFRGRSNFSTPKLAARAAGPAETGLGSSPARMRQAA